MAIKYYKCKKDHKLVYDLTDKKYETLSRKIELRKVVCPYCDGRDAFLEEIDAPSRNKWYDRSKVFYCKDGHVLEAYPFTVGIINIEWGDGEYENLLMSHEEFENEIRSGNIRCRDNDCNGKLKAAEDHSLEIRESLNIKTRTRVGDIWDKAGVSTDKDELRDRHNKRAKDLQKGKIEVFDDKTGKSKIIKRK